MARIASIFLLLFWITGLLVPAYVSLTDDSETSHWIVENHENEEKEAEEKECGETEFFITRYQNFSSSLELLEEGGQTFIPSHLLAHSIEVVLPPPERFI